MLGTAEKGKNRIRMKHVFSGNNRHQSSDNDDPDGDSIRIEVCVRQTYDEEGWI